MGTPRSLLPPECSSTFAGRRLVARFAVCFWLCFGLPPTPIRFGLPFRRAWGPRRRSLSHASYTRTPACPADMLAAHGFPGDVDGECPPS